MKSLYDICISKSTSLLRDLYWTGVTKDYKPVNHFTSMPVTIVNDLFTHTVDSMPDLQVSVLYLLLTSGRLQHFKLKHLDVSKEDFVTMLMNLSSSSKDLRTVVFRNLSFSNPHSNDPSNSLVQGSIECLLHLSPLLEVFESCIPINLKALRNSEHLKVLKVNFVPETPLTNLLAVDDEYWPNDSINVIEVYQDIRHSVPYTEAALILKYCKALTNFNVDISVCLEYLHLDEMDDGTLSTQYKLQKCILGSEFNGPASIAAVHIAVNTCPFMKEVDLLTSDNYVIYGLRDFELLSSLLVQWEIPNGGNFQHGTQMLLEAMGTKLTALYLLNFYNVDFAVIGACTPALEELKVEFISEYCKREQTSKEYFKNLKMLTLENTDSGDSVSEDTILMLLSNCTQLTNLVLHPATCLNDSLVAKILTKNSLSKVQELTLCDCALSEEGMRQVAVHLKNLSFFQLRSSEVDLVDAAIVVQSLNGRVLMVGI